jgi:hypothetical protein
VRGKNALLRLLPAAAATAALASACASSPGSSLLPAGPLGPAGGPTTQCTPGSPGHADTVGLLSLTNSSHDGLVIDGIDLAAPQHIKLAGAFLTPGDGETGVWLSFPPPAAQLPADVRWAQRVAAMGARIRPGETVGLVLGITPTSSTATASTSGAEVFYHDGGTRYELRTSLGMVIKVPPAKCLTSS